MIPIRPGDEDDRVSNVARPHLVIARASAAQEPLAETLLAIAQVPRVDSGLRTVRETIEVVCRRIEAALGYDRVVVIPIGPALTAHVQAGEEVDATALGRVLDRCRSGLATAIDLAERRKRDGRAPGRGRRADWRAAVFAPMLVRGQLVGALGCLHRSPHACDAGEIEVVEAVARMAATAFDLALAADDPRKTLGAPASDDPPAAEGFAARLLGVVGSESRDPVQRVCDLLALELPAAVVLWDLHGRRIRAAAGDDGLRTRVVKALRGRTGAQLADLADGTMLAGGMVVPIVRDDRLGLLIVEVGSTSDEPSSARIRQAAAVIALALDAELARDPDRNLSRPSTLHALVSGRLSPRQAHDVSSHVDAIGQPLRIGYLRVDDPATATATSHRVNFTLRIPRCLAAAAERDGVVLLLEDTDAPTVRGMIPSLLGSSTSRWALGVSEAFTDVSNAHDALNQALVALASTDDHHVAFYDTMGPTVDLLKHMQPGAATRFVDDLLRPLVEYDRAHHASLLDTVDAYLRNRCSLRQAAAELYVHSNTVQLRLARAAEVTQMDFHDPRQLGLLSIAFAWRSHYTGDDPSTGHG